MGKNINRYAKGLDKLKQAQVEVDAKEKELVELQPELELS